MVRRLLRFRAPINDVLVESARILGGGDEMKRLAREQKRFVRRWTQNSGAWVSRAALLGTAFLLGMVAA